MINCDEEIDLAGGQDKSRDLRFGKEQRLRLKTLVDGLFAEGKSLYEFPLRLNFRVLSPEELSGSFRRGTPAGVGKVQMMVSVPKKKRRHAVDRVLLRRRIREAYRLQRHVLADAVERREDIGTLSLGFVYIHTENADYRLISRKMRKLLAKVAGIVTENRGEATNPGA